MTNRIITIAASVAALAAAASAAKSDVYIGLQQAGVNGGAITQVASGPSFEVWSGSYGTFVVNSITISNLTGLLDSTALDVTYDAPGPSSMTIYVTSTDQDGIGDLASSFTANALPAGWSVTMSSYYDDANGVFTTASPLNTHAFSAIGTASGTASGCGITPCSITGVYQINAGVYGTSLNTIKVSTIREPESLGLLGASLLMAGLVANRRLQRGGV